MKIWNVALLVGGGQIVDGEPEAQHHAWNLQHVLKVGDDGNGAAGTAEYSFFFEDIVQGARRGFDVLVVRAHHAGWAFTPDFDGGLNAFGREFLYVVFVALENVVGVLVGHQAHRNFGGGFGRNDRLRAGGHETAGHAVDFEGGTGPSTIHHRIAGLAGEYGRSYFYLAIVFLIEREALPGFQLGLGGSFYIFVEAGNQNLALRILELADDFDQAEEWIGSRSAIHAGMQVSF